MLTRTKGWSIPILGSSQILIPQMTLRSTSPRISPIFLSTQINAAVNTKSLAKSTFSTRFCALIRACFLKTLPPKRVECIYLAYRQNVKARSWCKLPDITSPVYIMGKFVHKRLKAATGCGKPNSKMEALSVVYSFFMAEIALEKEKRRSANKVTMKATKLSKAANPLPSNFVFYPK
jgi:hypothetical protein